MLVVYDEPDPFESTTSHIKSTTPSKTELFTTSSSETTEDMTKTTTTARTMTTDLGEAVTKDDSSSSSSTVFVAVTVALGAISVCLLCDLF